MMGADRSGPTRSPIGNRAPAARSTHGLAERAWPETTERLAPGESLVLRAFRHWVAGLADGHTAQLSLAWNGLATALGPARGRLALSALSGLIRDLQHTRRRLRHHHPGCSCLTGDEVAVLAFVGACQRREWVLARSLAEWLVLGDGVGGLLESGARLGRALTEAGLGYPPRHGASPARPCAPEAVAGPSPRPGGLPRSGPTAGEGGQARHRGSASKRLPWM